MAEEIEKFDPSKLMQGVKDRIKATFVGLIPDEQWEGMVRKEVESFFYQEQLTTWSKKKVQNSYSYQTNDEVSGTIMMSPFRAMIYDLCREKTAEYIKNQLTSEWFGNSWPIKEEQLSPMLKDIIHEVVPLATQRFFESIAMGYMTQLRQDIQNHRI